jgi:hypothetical protein
LKNEAIMVGMGGVPIDDADATKKFGSGKKMSAAEFGRKLLSTL